MKLEIYRFEMVSGIIGRGMLEYMIYLNNVLMGNTSMERLSAGVEDTDKFVVSMILLNLSNNMDEVITRVINGNPNCYWPHWNCNCVYSSSSDKVLKELDIKLKEKAIEGDFK